MNTPPGRPSEPDPDAAGYRVAPGSEDVLAPHGPGPDPEAARSGGPGTGSGDAEAAVGGNSEPVDGRRTDATGGAHGESPAGDPARSSAGDVAEDSAGDVDRSGSTRPHRSPWNRTRDRVVALTLTVATVVAGVLVWAFSDSRATEHTTAAPPPPLAAAPGSVPPRLTERWRASSADTPVPLAAGDTVVTAEDGRVTGRDPRTGRIRWHYARDLPLCTAAEAFSHVHAVYAKDGGCSEVTQLDPATGQRTAQRNGDAEHGTRLVAGDGHVTATGEHLLNTWRSDLVKTVEYGRVPAPVHPETQPRPDCTYGTADTAAERVAVIEHCPGESGVRLTVLKAAGEEAYEPEVEFTTLLPERTATLMAISEEAVAVALPRRRELFVYDHEGIRVGRHSLSVPSTELAREYAGGVVPNASGRKNTYVFTGSHTIALDPEELTPHWIADGTRGPGTMFAHQYVVPIPNGLAVLDERNGSILRTIAVDRRDRTAAVRLAAAGPMLLEQRGNTVVALR